MHPLFLLSVASSSLLFATRLLFRDDETGLLLRADEVQACFAGSGLLFFVSAVLSKTGRWRGGEQGARMYRAVGDDGRL